MLASLNHAHLRFGPQEVLKDVTWALEPDEVWGVIGRNGAGKSTLFRVLLGELELDGGTTVRPTKERGIRMGHYAQDLEPETDGSILEETLAAFGDVEKLQHEMRDLEHRMGEPDVDLDAVMERYQKVQEAFERADGFTIRARAEGILFALGFGKDDLEKNVHELSGGQKSRVMLAKAILQGEDLLLLDEPTNHLDLPSLRWLEEFVNGTKATVAVISHDRYFLDKVGTSILEIEAGRSRVYEGNYTEFMEKKEQELEIQEKHFEQQQAYIKKQEEYIRRNIAGQNTKMAQGRRTHLQKLSRIAKPLRERRRVKFRFQETLRSGDVALVMDHVSVGWDGVPLFTPIEHLQVRRGQKLAIVGFNGTGKTTLLRAIAGQLEFLSGQCRLGSQVKLGYFDQHHANLDPRNTVFQQIQGASGALATKQDIYGFLAKFQFFEPDWDKSVTVLSGGERARLSIATLIRQGCNLLMLDEPTNHMDIASMEAMEDAILGFEGAVVLVTHDRYLLGRVSDALLRVHEGQAEYREGSYEEHQAWVDLDLGSEDDADTFDKGGKGRSDRKAKSGGGRGLSPKGEEDDADAFDKGGKGRSDGKGKKGGEADAEPEPKKKVPEKKPEKAKEPAAPAKPAPIDREKQKNVKRWERKVAEAEARVGELEQKLAALSEALATMDPSDWKAFNDQLNDQKQLESDLAYAMTEWEEAQMGLEEANR